ncbi:MAG TPA: hypothetical protein VK991_14970 [Halomonas sp.]|nr:hypothetical protein [Halomonas sp.]
MAIGEGNRQVKHWKSTAALALAVIALSGPLAPASQAAVSDFSSVESWRQLSDAELGQLRGRFVDKGRIMFFGIQMSSKWRTSAGEDLMAGANLRGDLSGATPSVTYEPYLTMETVDALPGLTSGNGAIVRDAGTGNARGVAQTIQAGGNLNVAANELQIEVRDAAGYRASSGASASNMEQRLPSGTRMTVSSGAQGLGVELQVPGLGSVTQSIEPSRGLRQSIQLTSDSQRVHNITRLQLYMGGGGTAGAKAAGVLGAVDSARQLRR